MPYVPADESRVFMLNGSMDFLGKSAVRIAALCCALLLLLATERSKAQGFSLIVTPSTNALAVNGSLSFTVTITNNFGATLTDVLVTNIPSGSQLFAGVTNIQGTILDDFTNNVGLVFDLGGMVNGGVNTFMLTVQPANAGVLTNFFQVVDLEDLGFTNTASTNIITQVYTAQADLAVALTEPLQSVITNDFTYFTLSVTNFGPGSVPNVTLTNTLPPGFLIVNIFPTNQFLYTTNTATNSTQIFFLGTLASGGFTNLTFQVMPTNSGSFSLAASVGAPNLADTNALNNFATNQLTVTNYAPGSLLVLTKNLTASVNLQNGLLELPVTIYNNGPNDVSALRFIVGLLSSNQLYNAVGTNYFNPFVVCNGPLAMGSSVQLLLQFAPRTVLPSLYPLAAFPLYASTNWSAPLVASNSAALNFTRIVKMPNGNMLLEFPTVSGQSYTVVYSDNVLFSNAVIAPPSVTSYANEMQWIDYGPPTTLSAPSNAPARFYRVYRNP
jgi:uncharacterized repeat protein (TIGR01451 family)